MIERAPLKRDSVKVSVGGGFKNTHVASRKSLRRAAALFPVLVLGALSWPLAAAGVAEDGDPTIDKAGCTVCHKMTPKLTAHSPREMHVFHKDKTPRPEAECFQCHIDAGTAQTKVNVFAQPQRNACGGCHPAVLNKQKREMRPLATMSDAACRSINLSRIRSGHGRFGDRTSARRHHVAGG